MGKNAHASASRSALCSWADARCAGMVSVQAGLVCVPVAVPVCWQDCCCIWVGGRERCSFSLVSAFFLFVMFSLCVREAASLLCLFMWLWLCAIMRAANSRRCGRFFTLGTLYLALLRRSQHTEDGQATGELDTSFSNAMSHKNATKHSRRQKNCYAGDVAIVDNHTAVTHASFLVT
jgi:hypothetical protein